MIFANIFIYSNLLSYLLPPLIEKLQPIFDKFQFHDPLERSNVKKIVSTIPKFCYELSKTTHIVLATYLDPRFLRNRRSDLDRILEIDMNEIKVASIDTTETVIPTVTTVIRKTALEELFDEDDGYLPNNVVDEINLFHNQTKIRITDCPLTWWKSRSTMFPNLSMVAKKYLCLSATSILSELVFSEGKRVMPDNRYRLTDEHTEHLIFLSMNSDIVPKK